MREKTHVTTTEIMDITSWEDYKKKFGKMPPCPTAKALMIKRFGEKGS